MALLKVIRTLRNKWYYYFNLLNFKFHNVEIPNDFVINGRIYISNNGTIKIGNKFKANSGKNNNPIGGDIILRLVCHKGASIKIGDHVGISNSTFVAKEKIDIGNNVLIGGSCRFWDTDFHSLNSLDRISNSNFNVNSKSILIENNAFIGGGCILLKGSHMGKNSILAAGSVLASTVPMNEIWGGNPAKFIKKTTVYG